VSNRAFGVEMECYCPSNLCDIDVYGDRSDGVGFTTDILYENGFSHWGSLCSFDESLDESGVEVKSPVLFGQPGFDELKQVVTLLNSNNFYVENDCGLHVHLDAPEFVEDTKLAIKTAKSWMKNQSLINNMVADHRIGGSYCEAWYEAELEELEEYVENDWGLDGTLRGAINFGSLTYHGTVEIRQHEGTLNYEEIESWIKFCQAFIDSMVGKEVRAISTEELFLRRLKVERNASRFLTTKARLNKQRREMRRI
jgi:putative amidoligase enzyme